jgi:hypothetical protein
MTHLQWDSQAGIGYFPPYYLASPYDEAYFENYRKLAATQIGQRLLDERLALVQRYIAFSALLDVGIGSGAFVERRLQYRGYDVNEAGIAWLKERDLYRDLYAHPVNNATFWDSLEHIEDPAKALRQVQHFAFVSLPIFRDMAHALTSKHFKPGEHIWYFTRDGFWRWSEAQGFKVRECNDMETNLGREDILTFVLQRAEPNSA